MSAFGATLWRFLGGSAALLSAAAVASAGDSTITYVPGSTVKLEQLIGDTDKGLKEPTANQTFSRYGIQGTDLGYSFEHKGKVYFLFGDTLGRYGGDTVGVSASTDPDRGLHLDFLTDAAGHYLKVEPPGVKMAGFDVPVSGISLGGKMYVVVKAGHSTDKPTDYSILTLFDESKKTFKVLRELSRLPDGRVIKMSMHEQMGPIPDLPEGGPFVLIWSSGVYRESNAYLSIVPAAQFESGKGTRYFASLDATGKPIWSEKESEARPVVEHPTIGDLSVTWAPTLKMWLMTYDSRDPHGIVFRSALKPWGPWSATQVIFNPRADKGAPFIHHPKDNDGLEGPVIGKNKDGAATPGGAYAPYIVERFTRVEGNKLSVYYVLSTWNPYVVVLMRSQFKVEQGAP